MSAEPNTVSSAFPAASPRLVGIDDDGALRASPWELLASSGLSARPFGSGAGAGPLEPLGAAALEGDTSEVIAP